MLLSDFRRTFGWEVAHASPNMSQQDACLLLTLAMHFRCETVLEFGVREGLTAKMLLDQCQSITSYVGLDLPGPQQASTPEGATVLQPHAGWLLKDARFRLIEKDSREVCGSELPQSDLVFVDGGHEFETALRDSELASQLDPKVVVWHDLYGIDDVTRALKHWEFRPGHKVTRVRGTCCAFEVYRGLDMYYRSPFST